jgi:hypothetical protein
VEYSAVPFTDQDGVMLSVRVVREQLAAFDSLSSSCHWTGTDQIEVVYGKGWTETELTEATSAWLKADNRVYQLTRQAAGQLASTCRVNRKFGEWLPPELLSMAVTWALREGLGEKEIKLLLSGRGEPGPFWTAPEPAEGQELSPEELEPPACPLAVAQTRATVEPFSNVELLDAVIMAARAAFGDAAAEAALIDYKFFSDWEHTSFRVVFPDVQQTVDGDEDAWCYGIEVTNSAIGLKQTTLTGYLFRFSTTGGLVDIENAAGGYNRRGSTPEAAYAWAAESAGEIFGGMEPAFDGLRQLMTSDVDGDLDTVMGQLFHDSPVSKELKLRVLEDLEMNPEQLTMLHLADAASVAANVEDSTWRDVRTLHDLAGHILHQGGGMCRGQLESGCRRLLPSGWEAPAAS